MEYADLDNLVPSVEYFVNRKASPSWNVEKSQINFNDLTFVYSGCAKYIVNGTEYTLKRGDFIYIPRGSVREAYTYPDNPVRCYALNFNWCFPNSNDITLPFPTTFKIGLFSELLDLYNDLDNVWVEKNPGFVMRARAILMLILHKLLSLTYYNNLIITMDHRIRKIKDYILSHYSENISIEDMANLVGLHPIYLGSLFKRSNNCHFKEYINRVRINIAENLLYTGGYSVSEAAQRCGFNDIFYFSKVFNKPKLTHLMTSFL